MFHQDITKDSRRLNDGLPESWINHGIHIEFQDWICMPSSKTGNHGIPDKRHSSHLCRTKPFSSHRKKQHNSQGNYGDGDDNQCQGEEEKKCQDVQRRRHQEPLPSLPGNELILWLDWLQCVSPRWKRSAQLQFLTDWKPYNLRW